MLGSQKRKYLGAIDSSSDVKVFFDIRACGMELLFQNPSYPFHRGAYEGSRESRRCMTSSMTSLLWM